jgi:hypothetical protein
MKAVAIACISVVLTAGFLIAIDKTLPYPSTPTKTYPIELLLHWSTKAQAGYPTMECDSIKGDTVYKDGNSIVVKNILNIKFK